MPLPKLNVITHSLKLPSTGKELIYRPFTVEEERILLTAQESDDTGDILRAMRKIIHNCVQTEIDVLSLPTFDIEYFFLNIRAKSTGEQIELSLKHRDSLNAKGEECDHKQKVTIDIEEIKVHKSDNHIDKFDLDNDIGVFLKYPTIESMAIVSNNNFESFVKLIALCIDKIYDKENTYESSDYSQKELIEFVYSMNQKQIAKIQTFFETSPRLQHSFKIKNPNTGVESDYEIRGLQNFFG